MPSAVDRVISFMEANLHRPLSLREMAGAGCVSTPHLYRLFRRQTGQSPCQYLKSLRLRRAAEWLRERDMSIKQVAFDAGYRHRTAFTRDFKRAYGQTPSAYKEQLALRSRIEKEK